MQAEEIKNLIQNTISDAQVEVQVDGSHIAVTVVSTAFEGLSPVKKQQLVYSGLQDAIASGAIHAVQIKALTPAQA
ncbi:MAG: acid stress-induced BolA-like protein IbaG/YrbA [Flavobacteriales bacterium]|jgi:acid stress-induced BolA-like protein IbaG/YrbA